MGIQTTASRTNLLLQCARPFAEDTERDDAESGNTGKRDYGIAFHKRMLDAASGEVLEESSAPIAAHVSLAWASLEKFLSGENIWGTPLKIIGAEKSLTYSLLTRTAREINLETSEHVYENLAFGEIGGTYDLLLETPNGGHVVLDYKTGDYGNFENPDHDPQLLTLALMTNASGVAIMHTPPGIPPHIYQRNVSPDRLAHHADKLVEAYNRIGDGSLRPNPLCRICPTRESCPANTEALLRRGGSILKAATGGKTVKYEELDRGTIHIALQQWDKIASALRARIREDVRSGDIIRRPDGMRLVLETRKYERLSKTSIIEAMGVGEGNKMLARLRKLGALTETPREELRAKKENGDEESKS